MGESIEQLIENLEAVALVESERACRNIDNLIGRLKHFDSINDEPKLKECIAEAELWLAA